MSDGVESADHGIHYLKGDAASPQSKGRKAIAHICNDQAGRGKGFVLALSRRWSVGCRGQGLEGEERIDSFARKIVAARDVVAGPVQDERVTNECRPRAK